MMKLFYTYIIIAFQLCIYPAIAATEAPANQPVEMASYRTIMRDIRKATQPFYGEIEKLQERQYALLSANNWDKKSFLSLSESIETQQRQAAQMRQKMLVGYIEGLNPAERKALAETMRTKQQRRKTYWQTRQERFENPGE
jgi:hypothetical protein